MNEIRAGPDKRRFIGIFYLIFFPANVSAMGMLKAVNR